MSPTIGRSGIQNDTGERSVGVRTRSLSEHLEVGSPREVPLRQVSRPHPLNFIHLPVLWKIVIFRGVSHVSRVPVDSSIANEIVFLLIASRFTHFNQSITEQLTFKNSRFHLLSSAVVRGQFISSVPLCVRLTTTDNCLMNYKTTRRMKEKG